jgi:hypothetical protein
MGAVHAPALYAYVGNFIVSAFDPWLIPSRVVPINGWKVVGNLKNLYVFLNV